MSGYYYSAVRRRSTQWSGRRRRYRVDQAWRGSVADCRDQGSDLGQNFAPNVRIRTRHRALQSPRYVRMRHQALGCIAGGPASVQPGQILAGRVQSLVEREAPWVPDQEVLFGDTSERADGVCGVARTESLSVSAVLVSSPEPPACRA